MSRIRSNNGSIISSYSNITHLDDSASRSSSISEVGPSWRQLSARITDSALYPYILRLAILTYRVQPRFLTGADLNPLSRSRSPDSNLSVPGQLHKTHSRSTSDGGSRLNNGSYDLGQSSLSSARSPSFSQKLPKGVPKLLVSKFKDMAQPGTLTDNPLLKRCYLVFYLDLSDPTTLRQIKETRQAEDLVMRFISCSAKELSKAGVPHSQLNSLIDKHCAAFVNLLIQTIKDSSSHSSSSHQALIKQLESYESSLNSSRGEVLQPRITASANSTNMLGGNEQRNTVAASFELDDMALAKDISSLLLISKSEIQRDIDRMKSEATEGLAIDELKSIQLALRGYDRHPVYQAIDFTSDSEYQRWKESEVEAIHKQIAIFENAARFDASTPRKDASIPDPTKGLYFIPSDTKSFYRHLLKRCLERDFTASGNERLANPESITILMSKSSIDILTKAANLWRIPSVTRAVILLDVSEEMLKEGLFTLANLDEAFNLAKHVVESDKKGTLAWSPHTWPYCDKVHFVTVLSEFQKSIMHRIEEALRQIYDDSPPKIRPYLEALDKYILAYTALGQEQQKHGDPASTFTGLEPSAKQIKRLKKTIIAAAEEKYGSLIDIIPRDHTLDPLHIVDLADKVIGTAKRLQKRYKSPLFGKISVPVISAEQHLTMFSLDSQSMFAHMMTIFNARQEEPSFEDMILLYKKMTEIRDLFVQVSELQFGFDIEGSFYPFVVKWAESSAQLAQTWVEPAIQSDKFLPVDEETGILNSISVVDIFQSFRSALDMVNGLRWRDEVQIAKILTILMKGVSTATCQYADRLLFLFLEDLKTNELSPPQIRSRQDKWINMAKTAVNGKEKVIPYNFLKETCVRLNNIELAQIELDKIESEVNSEQVYQILSLSERTQKKPNSFLFNVKIIQAEGLKACDMNGLSDPYVTLVDQTSRKQIGKTRTIYEDLNPVWNEVFEVATSGSKLLVATVWDENSLQNHDICGRAFIRLDPSAFQDFVTQVSGVEGTICSVINY
ncbi:hypothetical protein AWJ20_1792 [Sugiyamaella lignohabitans]|uniref:C2 domain-containing protein n=1 Tax=Sugiyamaella lignohabitans TaxID=796027 RepID=A0A167E0D7_9ASCO|nr:uncharacterized protein AWJ20_1792 [Sugiyamaella lignohabitans]ANB13498.1 hypothetical protein AWJ20_1792 [Sugiyamaella lignohabitans]